VPLTSTVTVVGTPAYTDEGVIENDSGGGVGGDGGDGESPAQQLRRFITSRAEQYTL